MKWHLSTQLYMLLSSDYWPVLSYKCHDNTTCPRSNFSKFLPLRDGRTKLKVELWATSHYLNQCWLIIRCALWHLSESKFISPQKLNLWHVFGDYVFNSLWPSDAIWRQGSKSALVQVMACCLTAPSHYLNQCWLIITKVQWCSSEGNFAWDITAISH